MKLASALAALAIAAAPALAQTVKLTPLGVVRLGGFLVRRGVGARAHACRSRR